MTKAVQAVEKSPITAKESKPMQTKILPPGIIAPPFELSAGPDRKVSLKEFLGVPVILVFYPADWSLVCGDQLALYNEVLPEFGAVLLAISVDGVWCHQEYARVRNFHFSLLSDFEPKGQVAKAYGAYRNADGYCERALFVIDPSGTIAWSYLSPVEINPGADGILDALAKLPKKGTRQ